MQRERYARKGGRLFLWEAALTPLWQWRLASHSTLALLWCEASRHPGVEMHRGGQPASLALGWCSRSCVTAAKLWDHKRVTTSQYLGLLLCKMSTIVFSFYVELWKIAIIGTGSSKCIRAFLQTLVHMGAPTPCMQQATKSHFQWVSFKSQSKLTIHFLTCTCLICSAEIPVTC